MQQLPVSCLADEVGWLPRSVDVSWVNNVSRPVGGWLLGCGWATDVAVLIYGRQVVRWWFIKVSYVWIMGCYRMNIYAYTFIITVSTYTMNNTKYKGYNTFAQLWQQRLYFPPSPPTCMYLFSTQCCHGYPTVAMIVTLHSTHQLAYQRQKQPN